MVWTNSKDSALRERAQAVIPNGMYGHQSVMLLPDDYPQFFERAQGAHMWDVDGNRYIDFMCGYGPNLFGYAHAEIEAGNVQVDGAVETRKRAKLRPGQRVAYAGETVELVAGPAA